MVEKDKYEPWFSWAQELQALAQCGLAYTKNIFDRGRFERIREISAEILSYQTGIEKEKVEELFCNETGFQTPKLDTRAAIFKDDKVLLVQENDGRWSLPGGWVDMDQSIASNTVKEIYEEAGLKAEPVRLIALHDKRKHCPKKYIHNIITAYVLCKELGGEFLENIETISTGYFSLDELPPIAEEKNSIDQIKMCFDAHRDENWKIVID